MKRLASAVQLRPWPPSFQQVSSPENSQHVPKRSNNLRTAAGVCRNGGRDKGKGRSRTSDPLLCAVVNGVGYFQAQFNPNTKQRACFFHTPYNQSAFQPVSWFAGERVASRCDIRASVPVLSDRKANTAQYGSTRKAATRAGACEGYIHLRDSLLS